MKEILPIVQLGSPILREIALPIRDIQAPEIEELIDDLISTCMQAKGMGIAAPQLSHSKRIFIMVSAPNERYPHAPYMEPTVIINPEILYASDELEKNWEGCLSLPGLRALVPRSIAIRVCYQQPNGEKVFKEFKGFLARIFLHEFDHLDGKVFIDRVKSTLDIVMEQEYQSIVKTTII